MSELIDRRAVIDLIDRYTQDMSTGYRSTNYGIPSDVFEDEVMALPTIQPERVEGEWIVHLYKFGASRCECDACHARCDIIYPYCPYCGEKKEGKRDAIN